MNAMTAPRMAKPEPVPTPMTQPFWDGARADELRLQQCQACGQYGMYPRPRCARCGSAHLHWVRASGRGTLHSYVISHLAAPGWEGQTPYVIAAVQLDEGPRLMSSLIGVEARPECLVLDMRLEVTFEPRGAQMLPVFRPAEGEAG